MAAYLNLSQALSYMESNEQAIKTLNEGLRLATNHKDKTWQSYFLGALGIEYDLKGDPQAASSHYQQAVNLSVQTHDKSTEAQNRIIWEMCRLLFTIGILPMILIRLRSNSIRKSATSAEKETP